MVSKVKITTMRKHAWHAHRTVRAHGTGAMCTARRVIGRCVAIVAVMPVGLLLARSEREREREREGKAFSIKVKGPQCQHGNDRHALHVTRTRQLQATEKYVAWNSISLPFKSVLMSSCFEFYVQIDQGHLNHALVVYGWPVVCAVLSAGHTATQHASRANARPLAHIFALVVVTDRERQSRSQSPR